MPQTPKPLSPGEATMEQHLRCHGISFDREVRLIPERRWRADFVLPDPYRIVIEVDGGIWNGGRHGRGAGIESAYEKINRFTLAGYRCFRYSTRQVISGMAIDDVLCAIGATEPV